MGERYDSAPEPAHPVRLWKTACHIILAVLLNDQMRGLPVALVGGVKVTAVGFHMMPIILPSRCESLQVRVSPTGRCHGLEAGSGSGPGVQGYGRELRATEG